MTKEGTGLAGLVKLAALGYDNSENLMTWHIGEILIQKKLISWEQLEDALAEQRKTKEFTGEILVRKHYISELLLYKALADQHKIRYVALKHTHINPKAVAAIPKSIAEKYTLMPIDIMQNTLTVGIGNPLNIWPESELKELTGFHEIRTVLCLPEDIRQTIKENYK